MAEWKRYPFLHTGKANYELVEGDKVLGYVRWCGHPTAHFPYFTYDVEDQLRTFRSVKEAKAFVEAGCPAWRKPE